MSSRILKVILKPSVFSSKCFIFESLLRIYFSSIQYLSFKQSIILRDSSHFVIFVADAHCLFRTINEIAHYLDQQRNRVTVTSDLFSSALESQRSRLCSYIEKLMFLAPVEYGRKCEEILWRKCFYDVYTFFKRLKKVRNSDLSPNQ